MKIKDDAPQRAVKLRRIVVEDSDIAAAQRLLSAIAETGDVSSESERGDRRASIDQARVALALRQRRMRIFEGSLSADPPFALMLALYANEDQEPDVTLTRLTELAWVNSTTATRWLDSLVSQGLVERRADSGDRRRTLLSLSLKARKRMDELFS